MLRIFLIGIELYLQTIWTKFD